jgi:hypothetical protein
MYAKVFAQIFDSSIAENYRARHVFEDLLKLADKTGVVDMTPEAISRRTNCPIEEVVAAISELAAPDPRSRSKDHEGRRIIPVDSRRDWGWIIVNYLHYRAIQDEEARRESWRNAKAKQRERRRNQKQKRVRGIEAESNFDRAVANGATEPQQNALITESLPDKLQ